MRKYQAHELTARQALAMAEEMAQARGCPIVWIAWLRSTRWGEFVRSETLHDWKDQRQTVLVFASERDARRFLKHNQIGGDWQTQPYPLATITDTCTQHGVAWRHAAEGEPWRVTVDAVNPITGEVARVPWQDRRPAPTPPPTYDLARIRWRMGKLAGRIAGVLDEIRLSNSLDY